jgi:tRNA-2-methylthio-N6-dimethylallyladenosine synthase
MTGGPGGPGPGSERPPRRYFVETWGCQMNEADSQRLAGQLIRAGVVPADDPGEADLILLNSCSVREKAAQKVYSRLGEYRRLKAERPRLRIGLCGCVAQQEGERALARMPDLDFVLGPARVGELTDLLPGILAGERFVATGFPEQGRYDFDAISRADGFKGMVTVIEGCDKRCTFCIVPSTRGPERCRPQADVVAEARHLLGLGFVEIELLGQTVNHWREPGGSADFADLLDAVAALPGLRRLRFVTSYPRDFTPRMIDRLRRHGNICDYLHLPVQSGSDRTLRRMGRGYTIAEYRDLVAALRDARPTVAVSTDLIVGFPGETEADFQATLELLEAVRFSAVYAFCYSPRPGTASTRLDGAVDPALAGERLQRLFEVQNGIQAELHRDLEGTEHEVLITGPGREPGHQVGRTSCHRIVHFRGAEPTGSLVRVRIVQGLPHSLLGELVGPGGASRGDDAQAVRRRQLLPVVGAG